ncbi:MAG: AAA family ATPase, partial [Dehalococcoidia bacterium]
DFRNTIIIMTSNVGSDLIRKDARVGFATTQDEIKNAEDAYKRMKARVEEEMKRVFRPEFINRIDQSVVFRSLQAEHIREIVNLELNDLRDNLHAKEMSLEVTDALLDHLGTDGFDAVFGARPLRRVIQNQIEDPLSDAVLQGQYEEGDTIRVDYVEEQVTFQRVAGEPAAPEEEPALTSP